MAQTPALVAYYDSDYLESFMRFSWILWGCSKMKGPGQRISRINSTSHFFPQIRNADEPIFHIHLSKQAFQALVDSTIDDIIQENPKTDKHKQTLIEALRYVLDTEVWEEMGETERRIHLWIKPASKYEGDHMIVLGFEACSTRPDYPFSSFDETDCILATAFVIGKSALWERLAQKMKNTPLYGELFEPYPGEHRISPPPRIIVPNSKGGQCSIRPSSCWPLYCHVYFDPSVTYRNQSLSSDFDPVVVNPLAAPGYLPRPIFSCTVCGDSYEKLAFRFGAICEMQRLRRDPIFVRMRLPKDMDWTEHSLDKHYDAKQADFRTRLLLFLRQCADRSKCEYSWLPKHWQTL